MLPSKCPSERLALTEVATAVAAVFPSLVRTRLANRIFRGRVVPGRRGVFGSVSIVDLVATGASPFLGTTRRGGYGDRSQRENNDRVDHFGHHRLKGRTWGWNYPEGTLWAQWVPHLNTPICRSSHISAQRRPQQEDDRILAATTTSNTRPFAQNMAICLVDDEETWSTVAP